VLKVPHHGSAHQDPGFAAAVRPRVAVVSVGVGNDYGQPNPGLLRSLARDGARVARTDTDGDVAIVTTARGIAVVRRGPAAGRDPP
jgi:competence protein ComEC